jgi:hypothetical protein
MLLVLWSRYHVYVPGEAVSASEANCPTFKSPWYGVRTRSNFEKIAATALQDKGYEQYLPTYRRRKRRCFRGTFSAASIRKTDCLSLQALALFQSLRLERTLHPFPKPRSRRCRLCCVPVLRRNLARF